MAVHTINFKRENFGHRDCSSLHAAIF